MPPPDLSMAGVGRDEQANHIYFPPPHGLPPGRPGYNPANYDFHPYPHPPAQYGIPPGGPWLPQSGMVQYPPPMHHGGYPVPHLVYPAYHTPLPPAQHQQATEHPPQQQRQRVNAHGKGPAVQEPQATKS
ncbi:hypothetical protein OF83DRAFT_572648 [Amylostereum chailletii]|nr:hypothetical protein OF83DRAFT_572648 [Amylostereum chailletii]